MLNLIRKFLRPTLREQLEDGVREALRRYAERQTAPNLRVYVSEDLLPEGVEPGLWARDEAEHLRRFALQWAEDNGIARAGMRLEVVLLDTKREFAFVKPVGLDSGERTRSDEPLSRQARAPASTSAAPRSGDRTRAVLEVLDSPALSGTLEVAGEMTVGRKAEPGVHGIGDRYMSARHARLRVDGGRLWVTDLDSKNRTFINDEPLPPHEAVPASIGDTLRMGTTVLRLSRVDG